MQVERSVEETAAGTSCAILVGGSLGCIDDALVAGQSGVGIGAEHEHVVAAHDHFCALLACNFPKEGINACLHKFLGLAIILVSFL